MSTTDARAYRTREYPSEIVHDEVVAAKLGAFLDWDYDLWDDPARVRALAEQASRRLGIHDNTAAVHDLLPLAVWAVLHGAPEELVTFADDGEQA